MLRIFLPLILLSFSFIACKQHPLDSPQPNIVLILTDDQGYGDLGFFGNPDIHTPRLDALAKQSTRFTQFYVSPVCAPTRASLMTGRYSLRTGVYDTYNGGAMMATAEKTLPELLQAIGYRTGIFGKWHLGDAYPMRPQDQGFDRSLIHLGGGIGQVGDYPNFYRFDSAYFDPVLWKDGQQIKTQGYCSDAFTDAALTFLEESKDQPFFLYLPFNAPHDPHQVPEEYASKYADLQFDPSRYPQKGRGLPEMSDWDKEVARKVYAMVENIDDNVGRVLDKLDTLGLADNTLVIFLCDNGPLGKRYTHGLRAGKGTVYEGGIRTPFFARLPGTFPTDQEVDIPAAHIDILPTLSALLGLPLNREIDGQDLLPLIRGEAVTWKERPLFFYWQRGFEEPYRNVAIRKGRYKMVAHAAYDADTTGFELFDLQEDPYEMQDLKAAKPEVLADLKRTYDGWYREIMQSPHLQTPNRIILGSAQENPVVLNRNDAKGPPAIWGQDKVYGYWDVEVAEKGSFDVSFHFHKPLPTPGQLTLRIGTLQRTLLFPDSVASTLHMQGLELPLGEHRLEAWYTGNDWQVRLPFWVEVERL